MRSYECIGGPMDGRSTPRPSGEAAFYCIDREYKDVPHFYRLCVSTVKINGRRRKARFWHYIGTSPDIRRRPTLKPPARLFK